MLAQVCAAGGADTPLEFGGFVCQDVPVEIRQDEYLELGPSLFIDQFCRHDIDIPVVHFDFRIILCNLLAFLQELAVGGLHHIGLGDDGDPVLAVGPGIFKGQAGDPFRTGRGADPEVKGDVIADIHALAAQRIHAFRIFTEESPVNVLLRHLYRTDIGKEIQFLTHSYIGTLHVLPLVAFSRCGGGALQDHMALFQFSQYVIRNGFAGRRTVFNGTAVDDLKFHFPLFDFACQQVLQHPLRLGGDGGTDAVAAYNADDDFIQGFVVHKVLVAFHFFHSGHLLLDDGLKLFQIFFHLSSLSSC